MTSEKQDSGRRRWSGTALIVAVALVVASLAAAVWYGTAWFKAENDDSLAYSKLRDEVVRVGEAAIVTFHTLDYRHVERDLDRWENASTGTLHQQLVEDRPSSTEAIVKARTITTARVLKSAVTELADREGTARILAAVEVTVQPDGGKPQAKYMRIHGTLQRTDAGWKLSGIGQLEFNQA